MRDIPKVLVSLGMCEASYKPQDFNIGFVYNVILDGRIIGYVPETLTALFIRKLRTLKVKGKQVNYYSNTDQCSLSNSLFKFLSQIL